MTQSISTAPAVAEAALARPVLMGAGNNSFAISLGLLLLRLSLGATFLYHGSQLLFGWFGGPGIHNFAKYLSLPVLPAEAWAYTAAIGQFGGGLLILLGLLTRLATLPILVIMWVAIATVHAPNGFSLEHQGYEYNVALIAMAAMLLLAGPGLISADAYLFRRGLWARGAQVVS